MTVESPLIGLIMPFVIDYVNRYVTDSKWRYVVSLLSCLAISLLVNIDAFGSFDWNQILQQTAVIFATAQTVYKLYWEKSTIRAKFVK